MKVKQNCCKMIYRMCDANTKSFSHQIHSSCCLNSWRLIEVTIFEMCVNSIQDKIMPKKNNSRKEKRKKHTKRNCEISNVQANYFQVKECYTKIKHNFQS